MTSLNLEADTHCAFHLGPSHQEAAWQRKVLVLVSTGSQRALEHSWPFLIRETPPIRSHSSREDQVTCSGSDDTKRATSLGCVHPDVLVTRLGLSPLSTLPAFITGNGKRVFLYRQQNLWRQAGWGPAALQPVLGGLGKRASVAWSTSVFIGSNRKNSNCCLLATGE